MVWFDGIYLSSDDTFDSGDTRLSNFLQRSELASESSYVASRLVELPMTLAAGFYTIFVVADEFNLVKDRGAESNNALASSPIAVALAP